MSPESGLPVVIIGGGPAGLMAAEVLSAQGLPVAVYDAMPSVGRKFLLAGRGGLNLTHSEPIDAFKSRYGERATEIASLLDVFGPDALRAWAASLGVDTFVGSSGRVFPTEMKAAPLLRAWLNRLRKQGVRIHVRHRWLGWTQDTNAARQCLRVAGPDGEQHVHAQAVILAMGGGSWARLGSDGAWVGPLRARGIDIADLQPANCGFERIDNTDLTPGWSAHFSERFAGQPVKSVRAVATDPEGRLHERSGECMIDATGIEGGLIYALSAPLRDSIRAQGHAVLTLDLAPARSRERLYADLSRPRGSRSLSSHIQGQTGLKGVKLGLLRECLPADDLADAARLAAGIKALPIRLGAPRPIDEAISTAGGVRFGAMNRQLMLNTLPGVFCAGEMLDWEAPTGGYLLTACFASGVVAAHGTIDWLQTRDIP